MPRITRIERLFVKPVKQWSPFPRAPLPFRMVLWENKKHRRSARVHKMVPPSQIPMITPYKEWPIIRGDLVEVMVGPDTGKQGMVQAVARKKNQIKVEGMNSSRQFVSDMGDGNAAFYLNEEPLHYSEVKLVDPFTGKPTDVALRYNEEGKQVRVCVQSGRVIPKPPFERSDWKSRSAVAEGESDTTADVVHQFTYSPSLLLFHEEIMKEMNIPSSVAKTGLERRDLIFKEIEEDCLKEQEERNVIENNDNSGIMGQLKSIGKNLMFWK